MFVNATYDRDRKTVHYFDEDGSETLYIGGSFAWRTNNPGNLTKPGSYVMDAAIGYAQRTSGSKSLFVIFPDRASGQLAHQRLLKRVYGNSTVKGMISKYAPSSENNTDAYVSFVTEKAGVSPEDIIGSLGEDKFGAVSAAMEQQEGNVPGVIKQLGKPVQVQLRDKLNQPFASQKIHVKSASDNFATETDENGDLPWIFSGLLGREVSLYYDREQGDLEKIGSFTADGAASAYTFGSPYYLLSARPRVHQTELVAHPAMHVVRAGETLSSIAAKYGTSVDTLVRINGLANADHIYARQHLRVRAAHAVTQSNPLPKARPSTVKPASPVRVAVADQREVGVVHQRNPESGHPQTLVSSPTLELSGAIWCDRFKGSQSVDTLNPAFKSCVEAFFAALKVAGIQPVVNATFRPAERSYLMYHAFQIAKGTVSPDKVERFTGVDIDWVHRTADGEMDLDASRKAATHMCNGFGLRLNSSRQKVGRPWSSRHNYGAAIDMNIPDFTGKNVQDAHGDEIAIKSFADLKAIGQSYGVRFFPVETMHWSDNGR
ncbi:LysM peptidoglycan-binding domain-containing protein [Paraburkholderia sp. DHOC27]|uniref:LysM peptidoglycan-binding domain-containing protein n=1 Tax=Paraburkholderia sp. DHOC27 TaxID=2303330 RepID=UPI000E3D9311|nr:LysM peptidoglycan-binding domain-containing protein [Paraburkholderia sp. DHOC27]RFU45008.1 LysM peptidoglycan-binding domain-containing protein [Paraburkholderia sp. DHOC27]